MKYLKHITLAALLLFAFALAMAADDEGGSPDKKGAAQAQDEGIHWLAYDVGLQKAAKENKHVFIDFTAKWCGYCKKMDRETFSKADVISMINDNFVPVRVDGDSKTELDIDGYKITESNLTKQEFGVRGYPTFWFLKPDGTKLGAITGYRPANVMMDALTFVKDEKYDTTGTDQKTDSDTGSK